MRSLPPWEAAEAFSQRPPFCPSEGVEGPSSFSLLSSPPARKLRRFCVVWGQMLRGIVKSRQRLAGVVRGYASAELAVAEPSQYLRFASPVPQPYNHLQALGSIPETKVSYIHFSLFVANHWTLVRAFLQL